MIKIITILFFANILLFAANPAGGEEKILSESSVIASIRPKVEYITKSSKEPFQDYFSKQKPAAVKAESPVKGEPGIKGEPAAVVAQAAKPELPSLTVQGVIWGGAVPCAIINNQVLKQGDSIAEVKIIKIKKESIEVLYKGGNYSLFPPASLSSGKNPAGGKNE